MPSFRASRSTLPLLVILLVPAASLGCTSPSPSPPSDAGVCPNDLPSGCPDAPSWDAEVASIISSRCLPCHGDGGVATPVRDFTTYDKVHAQRSAILNQVYACRMPPADAAPPSDAERAALLQWLVCNAPNN